MVQYGWLVRAAGEVEWSAILYEECHTVPGVQYR